MALLDFLKKKKQVEKAKPASVRQSSKSEGDQKKQPASVKTPARRGGFSFEAVRRPHISEKASYLSEKDQYIFEVAPDYNKNEVKNAVEGLYGVDVLSVNIIKIPAKKRRLGRVEGFKKGYKKAVVKIKNGQKIEIL